MSVLGIKFLEAGKYYRTRNGRRAYVAVVGCPWWTAREAIGWVEGSSEPESWDLRGQWSDVGEDELDLVAPWDEPPPEVVSIHGVRYRRIEEEQRAT